MVEDSVAQLGLLEAEVRILKPDVAVFFTGPEYDARLQTTFPDVRFVRRDDEVTQLRSNLLPEKSFKTYHPTYLRRAKKWNALDRIVQYARQ